MYLDTAFSFDLRVWGVLPDAAVLPPLLAQKQLVSFTRVQLTREGCLCQRWNLWGKETKTNEKDQVFTQYGLW